MKKNNFFRRFQILFKRNVRKVTNQAGEALNQEIEGIIDKTLSNQEMESLLVRAIEKLIIRMFKKYSLLIFGFIIILFVIQLVVLNWSIQALKSCPLSY
ncbi:hypothetical protein [Gloeothece verrucosa]|uniref:Uncharacterized protein n=1 Tax=Gloeothece verrucosa (strain PCC 7822) TaxID=497965 RepID=E0UJQ7_GLOV7|nr:hypothetical protein [Gloeothece verrucosa]ADN12301.1 hypothetical protein Cyan7822_0253 [Gloeothece verrucosa PCC 7822]